MKIHARLMAAVLVGGAMVALAACVAIATLFAATHRLTTVRDRSLPAERLTGTLAERSETLARDLGDLNEARFGNDTVAAARLTEQVAVDFDGVTEALDALPSDDDADGNAILAGLRVEFAQLRSDWRRLRDVSASDAGFLRSLQFDDRASKLMHVAAALQRQHDGTIARQVADATAFVGWGTAVSAAAVVLVVAAAITAGVRFAHRLDGRVEAGIRDVVVYAMARLAESRDTDTGDHVDRVQAYCRALADRVVADGRFPEVAADPGFAELMYRTSPLHDIGKVGIPDAVLLKPARLTPAEFEIMKRHATIGAETLDAALAQFPDARFLQTARDIAATHHERFDGTGYPLGLSGAAIPLCGRLVAVADVYDALTTRRVYKAAMPHAVARDIIVAESGRQFDPVLVEIFLSAEAEFDAIRIRLTPPPMPAAPLLAA